MPTAGSGESTFLTGSKWYKCDVNTLSSVLVNVVKFIWWQNAQGCTLKRSFQLSSSSTCQSSRRAAIRWADEAQHIVHIRNCVLGSRWGRCTRRGGSTDNAVVIASTVLRPPWFITNNGQKRSLQPYCLSVYLAGFFLHTDFLWLWPLKNSDVSCQREPLLWIL